MQHSRQIFVKLGIVMSNMRLSEVTEQKVRYKLTKATTFQVQHELFQNEKLPHGTGNPLYIIDSETKQGTCAHSVLGTW